MLETPHVVVGAAIATKITNPLLSIPLAFCSHFILEAIPHWNPHINTEMKKAGKVSVNSKKIIAADVALSLTSGFYIASVIPNKTQSIFILLACFAAVLPDLIEAPYFFGGRKIKFITKIWIPFKKSLQVDTKIIPGLITQLLVIAVSFYWIFN